VPALVGAAEAYVLESHTGGEQRNLSYLESLVDWGEATPFQQALLVDPQTSGGLLIAVPAARVREYVSRVEDAVEVGDVRAAGTHAIVIE
jgi:selenide,water dikinase